MDVEAGCYHCLSEYLYNVHILIALFRSDNPQTPSMKIFVPSLESKSNATSAPNVTGVPGSSPKRRNNGGPACFQSIGFSDSFAIAYSGPNVQKTVRDLNACLCEVVSPWDCWSQRVGLTVCEPLIESAILSEESLI